MTEKIGHIRYCPECGYIKIFCGNSFICPVCQTQTLRTEDFKTLGDFVTLSKEEQYQYVVSKTGHEIDPAMKRKCMEYEIRKELEYQEWKKNKDASMPKPPVITCPYCQSTNTRKITTASKAAHTFLFGIFSVSRNSKQWHCINCNSDF